MTLKEHIEIARDRLNDALIKNKDKRLIYQLSIELDRVISDYYRIEYNRKEA